MCGLKSNHVSSIDTDPFAGTLRPCSAAEVKKHVWTLTFGLAARLAYAAACVGDISMLHAGALLTSPLLPPLNLLLQWMATQQDIFRCKFCSPSHAALYPYAVHNCTA